MKITAFYIAEHIKLKELKESYAGRLIQDSPFEVFYEVDNGKYLYVFDYGAVVFANMTDTDISQNLQFLQNFSKNPLPEKLRDDFVVIEKKDTPITFNFDSVVVPRLDESVAKIVMLNTGHSVTMDFYAMRAEKLLEEVHLITNQMEEHGRINISRKNMLRFIGRTLNNKNRIVENLFIFDQPDATWEDEYLDKIQRGLVRTFELQSRFKEVEYTFKVIEDNLDVFRELHHHGESNKLEWIIIILICIEVADLLISKLF